jgi:uncharacterized protein (TIGR02284 family)
MAKNASSDIRSTLNDLITALKDGEEGFRSAAAKVADSALREQFLSFATQRAGFASELQAEVAAAGGSPTTSGSASGALHRGWLGLKAALAAREDHAILVEAERGEDSAVRNYRDALSKDFPTPARDVIERQYRQIMTAHDQIRALRDGTRTAAAGSTPAF